jgi:hypothetical protein
MIGWTTMGGAMTPANADMPGMPGMPDASATVGGVSIEVVDAYVLQPGDVVRAKVETEHGIMVAVMTADGRTLLVPPISLANGVQAAPAEVTTPVAAPQGPGQEKASADPAEKKRKLALWAGITLGVLTTGASILVGVVASRAEKSDSDDLDEEGGAVAVFE